MEIRWRYGLVDDSSLLLREGSHALGCPLEETGLVLLRRYVEELGKWSQRINLIARDTPLAQIVENHFLDSLSLMPLLQAHGPGVHLVDIGTGAGFPGLVLAAVLPQARFTLVEPRKKRVSFLNHVIRTLGLANVEVVADRIEAHATAWQGRFTHVTSRAVAEPQLFLPLIEPLVTVETRVLLMLAHQETLDKVTAGEPAGWSLETCRPLQLPFSGAPRLLAVVRRI